MSGIGDAICNTPIIGMACSIPRALGGAAHAVANSALKEAITLFTDAAAKFLESAMTWFLSYDIPHMDDSSGAVGFLRNHLVWYTGFAALMAMLFLCIRMAIKPEFAPVGGMVRGWITLIVVTGCSTAGISLLLEAGNAFCTWILADAKSGPGGPPGSGVTDALGVFGAAGAFILAILVIVASIAQVVVMLCLTGILVVACGGGLTITAAISGTHAGHTAFRRMCAFAGTAVLYKPVVAILFAASFQMVKESSNRMAIAGVALMILCIFAAPALFRMLMPAMEMVGGSASGAGAAVAGGTTQVASGAASTYYHFKSRKWNGASGSDGASGSHSSSNSNGHRTSSNGKPGRDGNGSVPAARTGTTAAPANGASNSGTAGAGAAGPVVAGVTAATQTTQKGYNAAKNAPQKGMKEVDGND